MPKIIELTVEIDIQKVSCPGVWLCQDGRVRLTVYALGTAYQTCLLPPILPLLFKDVFYFKKRFRETCAINNICCLLKDETLYCELVQWSEDCTSDQTVVLAQYLGSLNDVLFPPHNCSNDGVDLLTRRTKAFPGILSPKIEIATKVRIDEVWSNSFSPTDTKPNPCQCMRGGRTPQKPSCHSARYHRFKCNLERSPSRTRSKSGSKLRANEPQNPLKPRNSTSKFSNVDISDILDHNDQSNTNEDQANRLLLESRFIAADKNKKSPNKSYHESFHRSYNVSPCVCEICKKYHQLFHKEGSNCEVSSERRSLFL